MRLLEAPLRRLAAIPRPLALLLALGALQALAWTVVTPPLQGPDEPAHVAYAQHLAETGHRPSVAGGDGRLASTEQQAAGHAAGLDVLSQLPGARPAWSLAAQRRWDTIAAGLPASARRDGAGPNYTAQNPPLFYAWAAVAYRVAGAGGFFTRVEAMRLASSVLYLAVIALTWMFAGELLREPWLRTLATAVVTLLPLLAFAGGIVNPDVALVAEWAAFFVLAARLARLGAGAGRIAGLLGVAAAAALTHGRGLALLPPVLVAVGLALGRRATARARLAGAGAAAALLAVALVVLRPFSAGGVYQGQGGFIAHGGFSPGQFLRYLTGFYLPNRLAIGAPVGPNYGFRQVFVDRFFGGFGALDVTFPHRVGTALEILALLGLAGLAAALAIRRRAVAGRWELAAVLVVTIVSLLGLLHLSAYEQIVSSPRGDPLLVGRYLLPLAPLFGCAVALVAGALPRRAGPVLAGTVLGAGVLLALGGLGLSLARFYA